MSHKRFTIAALVVVLALTLSGLVSAQDPIVLDVWTGSSGDAENAFKEAQFAAFEEANPGVELNVLISPDYGTQIQAAFAANDYPEVFTVGQGDFGSLVDSELLMAAGDRITEPDDVYPGLLATFSDADGNAYCVPKDFSTLALYYNTDYFDAAGVDYPTAEWTWEDMSAAAQAITDADITTADGAEVVGFSAQADRDRWMAFFQANGATLFDDEGNIAIDSPAAIEALDFYSSFVEGGVGAVPADLGGAGWNGEAFGRGMAAMTVEGNWAIGYLQTDFPELNWGVAEIPTAPSGEKGTLSFTECWAVSAAVEGTPAEQAAWDLVNFLTGPEGAASVAEAGFGVMPARISAGEAWLTTRGEEFAPFVTGGEYSWSPVYPVGYGDFVTTLNEGTTEVLTGGMTAEEALTEAAEVGREIQAELGE